MEKSASEETADRPAETGYEQEFVYCCLVYKLQIEILI